MERVSPELALFRLLAERGMTFSAAESCTGGLIAARFTDLPGASRVFRGGVVSYTNAVKNALLGVPEELLAEFGAVSDPVARAMAAGCRRSCGSDIAVSVTGVAGPDRDDRGNPVGTVFVGLSTPAGESCRACRFDEDLTRAQIRALAADAALELAAEHLGG